MKNKKSRYKTRSNHRGPSTLKVCFAKANITPHPTPEFFCGFRFALSKNEIYFRLRTVRHGRPQRNCCMSVAVALWVKCLKEEDTS